MKTYTIPFFTVLLCITQAISLNAQTKVETDIDNIAKVSTAVAKVFDDMTAIENGKYNTPPPDATLRLQNNTDNDVYTAYAYYDFDAKLWVSNGWFVVPASGTIDINLPHYAGYLYLYGMSEGLFSDDIWGGNYYFYINKKQSFHVRDADNNSFGAKNMGGFSQVNIPAGATVTRIFYPQ